MARELHQGLLFLPCLQLPVDRDTLRHCYEDSIKRAITAIRPDESEASDAGSSTRLDIAVLCDGGSTSRRNELYPAFQRLLAELYTLAGVQAGRADIELDFPGGVDVRIFAVDAPYKQAPEASKHNAYGGPFTSMAAFLASRHTYDHFFCPGQENLYESVGARMPADYMRRLLDSGHFERVGSANEYRPVALRDTVSGKALEETAGRSHTRVIVGGTFDHLHIGHKLLLAATVFIAQPGLEDREITVGITGDELLVNKKHAQVLESWDVRQQRAADFVESILVFDSQVSSARQIERTDNPGPNGKVVKVTYTPPGPGLGTVAINYVRISDPFGPTITDESVSALVISAETRAGGKAVNDKRTEKGWAPLEVFEVDVLDAGSFDETNAQDPSVVKSSFESKVSSTEIRRRLAAKQS